jgi:hypothetical protein
MSRLAFLQGTECIGGLAVEGSFPLRPGRCGCRRDHLRPHDRVGGCGRRPRDTCRPPVSERPGLGGPGSAPDPPTATKCTSTSATDRDLPSRLQLRRGAARTAVSAESEPASSRQRSATAGRHTAAAPRRVASCGGRRGYGSDEQCPLAGAWSFMPSRNYRPFRRTGYKPVGRNGKVQLP